jgi:drug/metabolite transporter superfamily protein YnfA
MERGATRSSRRFELALTVGYVALAGATLSAYTTPATGFELSIYEGTPLLVWVSLGVALTLSLLVSFSASGTRLGIVALVLGGASVGLVAALPLVRGYRFYGAGDGLTHVGWTVNVANGTLNPFGLFYPGLHTVSVFLAELAAIGTMRAMLLVVLAITLCFLVFVPLCTKAITGRTEAAYAGAFVACCLLPINHIATHYMEPHPITQAILLSPVVLYLLVQYVLCERSLPDAPLTATGTLLALSSASLVLFHPQQAANVLVLLATIATLQAACRLVRCGGEIRAHRPLYGQVIWLAFFFTGWAAGRETFVAALNGVTSELAGYLLAGSTDAAAVVGQRGGSLGAIGASTAELFVKLLLVPTVFAGLTAVVMYTSLLGRSETTEPETTALLRYFTAGLLVLVPYSLLFFIGSVSKLFFRNLGFIMVLVSVVGAIAVYRLAGRLSERLSPAVRYPAMTVFLGAALVLSMVVVFPSPYVYLGSGHVTDDRLGGYDTAFANQAPGVEIYGVRGGPWRYRHATAGVTGTETGRYEERSIAGGNLTRVRALASEDRYFLLTRPDVRLETDVYEGLRYTSAQFRSLERQPGVHVVQYNGEVTLYRIEVRRPAFEPRSVGPTRSGRNAAGGPNGSRPSNPDSGPEPEPSATNTSGSGAAVPAAGTRAANGTAGLGSIDPDRSVGETPAPGPPPSTGNETNASSPGGDRPDAAGEGNGTAATNTTVEMGSNPRYRPPRR